MGARADLRKELRGSEEDDKGDEDADDEDGVIAELGVAS